MISLFHPQETPVSMLGQVQWNHPELLCILKAISGRYNAGRAQCKRSEFHTHSAKPQSVVFPLRQRSQVAFQGILLT